MEGSRLGLINSASLVVKVSKVTKEDVPRIITDYHGLSLTLDLAFCRPIAGAERAEHLV
jgi:hypothetical protein